jgi:hypothetical protein
MIKEKIMSRLQDVVIFRNNDGSYNLFNRYSIKRIGEQYEVSNNETWTTHTFSTLRNATIWCVADKRNKIYDAARILELDRKIGSVDTDISIFGRLIIRNKKIDDKLIFITKLDEAQSKKNALTAELNCYINLSNIWQTKQFQKPNIS